jgi:hypothetical protein
MTLPLSIVAPLRVGCPLTVIRPAPVTTPVGPATVATGPLSEAPVCGSIAATELNE